MLNFKEMTTEELRNILKEKTNAFLNMINIESNKILDEITEIKIIIKEREING